MLDISAIDLYVSRQGNFCLIDWMLAKNFLNYADYESWRNAEIESLDDVFLLDSELFSELVISSESNCRKLGLIAEPQDYYSWNAEKSHQLLASVQPQLNKLLSQRWIRPQDRPQLDLFMDNSTQITEYTLQRCLGERRFDEAHQTLRSLSELNPEYVHLGAYQDLVNYGVHIREYSNIDSNDLLSELQGLKNEVMPLAKELLGGFARDYLSFAWRRLSDNLENVNFSTEQPELHASFALLEIPDYPAAMYILLKEKALFKEVLLLERLAICYAATRQNEKSMLVWCLMMEVDCVFTEAAIEKDNNNCVYSCWQDFWEENAEWATELFPAYLLLKNPGLIHHIDAVGKLMHAATVAMLALLKARANAEDEINVRKALHAIYPELLAVYLKYL